MINQTSDKGLSQVADLIKVIAQPTRLKIIQLLAQEGPLNVSSLRERLQLDQPLVSHHLIKMKDKGVLIAQRKSKEIHYSLSDPMLDEVARLLVDHFSVESTVL